jgi:putative holliday junction resolvase
MLSKLMAPQSHSYILGLDVGEARIGLAIASTIAKLPRPLAIYENNEQVFNRIAETIKNENISLVVVGLPRNMSGQETAQSRFSRQFAEKLAKNTPIKIVFSDESLSSVRAEDLAMKRSRNPKRHLDDEAACFILEEYLNEVASD